MTNRPLVTIDHVLIAVKDLASGARHLKRAVARPVVNDDDT
jgi:hypothetical protein